VALNLFTGADPVLSWWLAISIVVVVTIVVAILLSAIIATAKNIDDTAAEIWARGQRVANNTIHVANLYRTRDVAGSILGQAGQIAEHAAAIRDHAKECPGCPSCIWSGRRMRQS